MVGSRRRPLLQPTVSRAAACRLDFSTAHFFVFFLQWLLARRISSRGTFTRDRPDCGSLAGWSQPPARAPGLSRPPPVGCTSAPSAGRAPDDDVPSSPGTGAGGEVAAPHQERRRKRRRPAEAVVAGSRRHPPSPKPRAACRLTFSAALFLFYLRRFLARRLPCHGPRVRSTCQRKSGLSVAAVRAGAGPGCRRGRVSISHNMESSAGARASPGEGGSIHIDDLIPSISLFSTMQDRTMSGAALAASSCSRRGVLIAVCGGGCSNSSFVLESV